MWADHIIICDQNSEDNSLKIAKKFSKVILIHNKDTVLNEYVRQLSLIQEARKIPGKRILVALDADEVLSANCIDKAQWSQIIDSPPGTMFTLELVNLLPNFQSCWIPGSQTRIMVDDPCIDFKGSIIHSKKLPESNNKNLFKTCKFKILHYQYTDWDRMRSKHNWYQTWETLTFPEKSSITIYRSYHHMYAVPNKQFYPIKKTWFEGYENFNINMFSIKKEKKYYWDKLVLGYLEKYGAQKFAKNYIWYRDWEGIKDPRNNLIKLIHYYLHLSQPYNRWFLTRAIDKILRIFF